jgi:hypothetical protein
MSRVCQRCGATRDAERFCPSCGLDFWRAAADDANPPPAAGTASAPPPAAARGIPIWLVTSVVGVLLLVVAIGVWILSGARTGVEDRPPVFAPRPEVHPLLTAFYREARDSKASFAIEQEGTITVTGATEDSADLSAHGRIDGEDWIMRIRLKSDDASFAGDVALVDNVPYARELGDDWQVGDELSGSEREPVNPFARISTVTELEYVGVEERDGVEGNVLVTEKWLGAHNLDPLLEGLRLTDREARMEIFVSDAGVPISAEYTFTALAGDGDRTLVFSGATTFRFSDWDDVEPIEPPIPPT